MARVLVERKSLTAQVANALREAIMSGEYAPGFALRQQLIAGQLGVSRIPLREALKQLEAEGLIENIPFKGAIVKGLSRDEIIEYCEIRCVLETTLLKNAMRKMTDDACDRADAALRRSKSASANHWGLINWELHSALYEPAGQPIALELASQLYSKVERYTRLQLSISECNLKRSFKEHKMLVDMCRQRDKKAIAHLKKHILGACDDLVAYLKKHQ